MLAQKKLTRRLSSEEAERVDTWALTACAADPAMQQAFLEAGSINGWVSGVNLRAYCEREGLMRVGKSGPGVAKSALAQAWDLADVYRDERGLSFNEFCVFMHLLCIATAGGVLPKALPSELRPPEPKTQAELNNDELIARALQDAYDDEFKDEGQAPAQHETQKCEEVVHISDSKGAYRFDSDALRDLVLAQGTGLLELEGMLFACDEAIENERWSPGNGFSSDHLLATDVAAWSSEDGSVSSPERDFVAPARDANWTLVSNWRVHFSAAADRSGWAYCRGLPSPLAPGASYAMSAAPFAGAVARRRRWTRISARNLNLKSAHDAAQHDTNTDSGTATKPQPTPPALLARLQDSFRSGVSEINRRLSASSAAKETAISTPKVAPTSPQRHPSVISAAQAKWQSSPAAHKCKAMIGGFCRSRGSELVNLSDEQRAERIKNFISESAQQLRSRDRSLARDDELFEDVLDELEAELYRSLEDRHIDLITETDDADIELAAKLRKLQPVTPDMLDAVDVENIEPQWPRSVDSIRSFGDALTPRRKVRRVRAAVDDIFGCLAKKARDQRSDLLDKAPGADDLLPLVILATLRARPPKLLAHLKFVELYGHRLSGEEFFLLTQLAAAASFLQNVDATQLKAVTPEAFDALMQGDVQAFRVSMRNTSQQDLLLFPDDGDRRAATKPDVKPNEVPVDGAVPAESPNEGGSAAADSSDERSAPAASPDDRGSASIEAPVGGGSAPTEAPVEAAGPNESPDVAAVPFEWQGDAPTVFQDHVAAYIELVEDGTAHAGLPSAVTAPAAESQGGDGDAPAESLDDDAASEDSAHPTSSVQIELAEQKSPACLERVNDAAGQGDDRDDACTIFSPPKESDHETSLPSTVNDASSVCSDLASPKDGTSEDATCVQASVMHSMEHAQRLPASNAADADVASKSLAIDSTDADTAHLPEAAQVVDNAMPPGAEKAHPAPVGRPTVEASVHGPPPKLLQDLLRRLDSTEVSSPRFTSL